MNNRFKMSKRYRAGHGTYSLTAAQNSPINYRGSFALPLLTRVKATSSKPNILVNYLADFFGIYACFKHFSKH